MDVKKLLADVTALPGVSGHERRSARTLPNNSVRWWTR